MGLKKFLSESDQKAIVESIKAAELCTSGEIRVHVEPDCKVANPLDRAVEVFGLLKMHETRERNGVLIYIAYNSHQFAIIGDKGIDERVPANFWGRCENHSCRILEAGKSRRRHLPCD